MVKAILLIAGSIPVILAILIAIPMITKPDIPFSALVPTDTIELEYTRLQLQKISFGVTDKVESQKTEILVIKNDGNVRYSLVDAGIPQADQISTLPKEHVTKLAALIKETGFMSIPTEPFPIKDNVTQYQQFSLKITLNGKTKQIRWPEQNATDQFIPPIITLVGSELDKITNNLENNN